METVILGPRASLHEGVHASLVDRPPHGVTYDIRDARHCFLFPSDGISPHRNYHWGEFVDFGPGPELVHTHRWPVFGRRSWISDTDDLEIPLVCGRHALNPEFRRAYRKPWNSEYARNISFRIQNMLAAYAHPSCKAILFRSSEIANRMVKWCQSRIEFECVADQLLPKFGVLAPAQEAWPLHTINKKWESTSPFTVLFCGRDYQRKNGALASRVMSRLMGDMRNIRCVYIGDIPAGEQQYHGKSNGGVTFLGSISRGQALEWFGRSHVLFHPSKREGLGTVFLEASAAGMAVVVACGGEMAHTTEIFGEDGALYVDRDQVRESAEEVRFEHHLRSLLSSVHLAREMGYKNYRRILKGHYSMDHRDRTLEKVYRLAATEPFAEPLSLDSLPRFGNANAIWMTGDEIRSDEKKYWPEIDLKGWSIEF